MSDYKHIDQIASPADIKNKSLPELIELAAEIRRFIIDKVSVNGGHLSSNLGVVEATIALHRVFDSPHDKLIFDVGHQTYTHKILTGRAGEFIRLRRIDGLSGFPKYSESIHDVFETGHSSTSIGAMCGFLEEKAAGRDIGEVVAFIGDGSLQNGLALSALDFLAGRKGRKGIVIINDNEMSISPNVGGITELFNKLRIRRSFNLIRKLTPVVFRNAVKTIVYRNVDFFNQLGLRYLGPVDGHNLKDLIEYFEYAKKCPDSIIIHIKTIKGKGYSFSEQDRTGIYHGVGPFDPETGKLLITRKAGEISFSEGIADVLDGLMEKHQEIKILTPAMIYGTGLSALAAKYPDRVIDVGISEENACVMASVMARCGSIPIVVTYATFYQRAYDQINHDICRSREHVVLLADHAGLVPGDGDTHQGIFDIALFGSLPHLVIAAPATKNEAAELLEMAIKGKDPFMIRYPKANIPDVNNLVSPTVFGHWKIVRPLRRVNILAYGPIINEFPENGEFGLINALFIKPLDGEMIKQLNNTVLCVFEEAINVNSLADLIIGYAYRHDLKIEIHSVGIPDFGTGGTLSELREKYGLDPKHLPDNIGEAK